MEKSEAAAYLAGAKQVEGAEASAPTNLHVISGEVVEKSENGKVKVDLGGIVYNGDDDQHIEIDTLGGLEVGDTATILLSGQEHRGMTPLGVGGVGTVDRIVERVSSIEADYIKTEALEAERARIDELETTSLTADSAVIQELQAGKAFVDDLTAKNITADRLEANSAYIKNLELQGITTDKISAATGYIDDLTAMSITTDKIQAASGYIDDLTSSNITAANIAADHATVGNLDATYATIDSLDAEEARVDNLLVGKASVADLTAANGRIDSLESTKADISFLESDYITAAAIDATYLHADMSNADVAWIQNGVIKDGSISNAMINSLSANKLTAGTINGEVINVTNLNADNIKTGTINGMLVGEGTLSLSKLEEDVYTEQEVDDKLSAMQAEIDGAIETWTGTAVPTLNNSPASNWTTAAIRDTHVGDVYFVVNSQSEQNGYNYRFTKSGSTYSWQLIKDSDVTNALQRISTAEGKITTFDSDISKLKTDTGTLTTKTESLETRMSDAESDILDKVDTTTFNEVSDTVDQHSQTITQMSQTLSNKADGSTVTSLTQRVSKNEQDISGINTTIGELSTTVESKADSSTVETVNSKLNTVSNTVDGHTQSISSITSTQTTMQGKLDKTIVESTQLWYTKANTTAPSKPTSQVTSTSTSGGAWRTVVPAYSSSYPNYFYCYQWKYSDGTYGWSSVTRDIAMGESQSTSRTAASDASTAKTDAATAVSTANTANTNASDALTKANTADTNASTALSTANTAAGDASTAKTDAAAAVSTANTANTNASTAVSTANTAKATADKNVKSTVQLWYTKADETAPSKPTSKVTSTAVSGNGWRTVVPTYSSSYPYYYYCYQYELADGTYTWSDVVYDRATTENQSNSRSAVSGVSTLTTKTNEISNTVDGHTSQLTSITETQTTIQGSAVKSTVQLWFTKANTTAPSKPTAHVTTNDASKGNQWNLAVPTYNSSYPYYYYCYEHQLLNDTYTWSAVTRDIATEESQSTSRSAKATADKNIKESQQLWYTKANSTAPAKPTSKVTSTATTGGGWRTVVPTYSDDYKHYFYCMQYVAADGTATWSDVVYDQATTEAQSVARAASADLTEFHQEYATFKQTTQQFESTVGETYATKNELKTTDDKIENLEIGGRNRILNTLNPSASKMPTPVGLSWGSTNNGSLTFTDGVMKFESSSTSGEHYIRLNSPSHTSHALESMGIPYPCDMVLSGYYKCSFSDSAALLTVRVQNSNGTSWLNQLPLTNLLTGRVEEGGLIQINTSSSVNEWSRFEVKITVPEGVVVASAYFSFQYYATPYATGDTFEIKLMKLEKGNKATDWTPAPEDIESSVSSIEERVSTAETSITNNSREIELRAKASDVYTKAQSDGLITTEADNRDAAIKASADAINLSVSQTYTTKTEFALNSKGTNLYAVANQTNGYLAGIGTFIASPDSTMLEVTSDFIPVGGASTVSIQTWVERSRIMWMAYSFYTDKDMSTATSRPSKTTTGTYLAFENVAVPSTANYIRVAYRSYGEGRCKVELDGLTAWSEAPADTSIYAAKAEIKVATDGISSTVSKIASAKYVDSKTASWPLASLKTYAAEGHSENWNVVSTDGLRVGDTVYVKGTDGTRTCTVYIKTTVTAINSATNFTGTSHGYEDVLPVESIKSTINQSSDSVKIQARHVEIDGEAIFSAISDDIDAQTAIDASDSGTSVAIDSGATAPLKGLRVLGESVQDGTPTPDAPIPIVSVGGVNLLVDSDTGSGWAYSTFDASTCEYTRSTTATGESYVTAKPMTFEAGQTYTLSCWAKSNGYVKSLDVFKVHSSGGGSHQSRAGISLTTEYQRISWTFVCNATTTETAYIRFDNNGSTTSGTEAILYIKEPQLEVGPNCNPYVPTGSLGLWLRGKNLLSFLSVDSFTSNGITYSANASTQTISVSGTATANNTDMNLTLAYPIHVPEGATVTLSLDGTVSSGQFVVFLYDGSYFEYHSVANGPATFTEAGGRTIRLVKLRSNTSSGAQNINARIQLELGSEATEYEPYNGSVTPIPLNGHELRSLPDGTQDELAVDTDGHVTMVQRVGSITFDGSETWSVENGGARSVSPAITNLSFQSSNNETANMRSDRFAPFTPNASWAGTSVGICGNISTRRIYFSDGTKAMTASSWTEWLTANNTTVLFPYATPQTINLGTIDMPQVKDGDMVEVIAALTPSIEAEWWTKAGQSVADNVTVINGDRIRTGTIDAETVDLTNLNADNITSGQLSAERIDTSSLLISSSQVNGLESKMAGYDATLENMANEAALRGRWVQVNENGVEVGKADDSGSKTATVVQAGQVDFVVNNDTIATAGVDGFSATHISTPSIDIGDWSITVSGDMFSINYIGS